MFYEKNPHRAGEGKIREAGPLRRNQKLDRGHQLPSHEGDGSAQGDEEKSYPLLGRWGKKEWGTYGAGTVIRGANQTKDLLASEVFWRGETF